MSALNADQLKRSCCLGLEEILPAFAILLAVAKAVDEAAGTPTHENEAAVDAAMLSLATAHPEWREWTL